MTQSDMNEKVITDNLENGGSVDVLLSSLRDGTLRYEKLLSLFSMLRRISDELSISLDFDKICRTLVEIVFDGMNAENCCLMLVDSETGELEVRAAVGLMESVTNVYGPKDWNGKRFRIGEGIAGAAAKEKESIIIEDVKKDKRYISLSNTDVKVGSILCAPLIHNGNVIGVFNLSHSEPGKLDKNHERSFKLFAGQAALLLYNAQLHQQLREAHSELSEVNEKLREEVVERKKAEEEIKIINESLEERVQKRTDELNSTHEQLWQLQKMEAIGTLAGGMAHDFNNLLTGILGFSSLLKEENVSENDLKKAAEVIESAATRGAEMTAQLLGFARKGKHQNIPIDIHNTIQEVIDLLSRTIDKNIHIVKKFQTKPSTICGDPAQIQQLLLNLAINARDAMPEGGELIFETSIVELDDKFCQLHAETKPGQYIMTSVSDTGCGIKKEILDRIFEPFFTTKKRGEGTGMGLAMVYGIAKSHDGAITVSSKEGVSTTYKVYFPFAREVSAVVPEKESTPVPHGKGRILLIDDEEVVLTAVKIMLTHLGYIVEITKNGREAIDYYKKSSNEIDLVILDMIMPGMGGHDCFLALKEINPNIKAILSTGYEANDAVQKILDKGMSGFIQKPYLLRELSEVVLSALKK